MLLLPHRRQFIISRQRHAFGEDWRCLNLPNGFILSYQADLQVAPEGEGAFLLGAGYAGSSPASLTGRFVRLVWPHVEPDSSALLSVYYMMGAEGPVVSSSPALLARLAPHASQMTRQMSWGGLNWVPGPGSRLAQVRKLLPGQRLDVARLAVDDLKGGLQPVGSVDEARTILAEELTATVRQVAAGAETIYLALTAGLDSRTLAAALLAAGMKFEVVTQTVHSPIDVRVAARICRYLGVRHHIIDPQQRNEAHLKAWEEHSFRSYSDADNNVLIPCNQYRFLAPGTILLRGGCFEIGRRFYATALADLNFDNATGEELWRRFERDNVADAETVRFLDEWLAARRGRDGGLDLVDAFYNDQRLGGWLAALEQALDILPGASVQPANSDRVKEALLAPEPEERAAGMLQRAVIQDLEPKLLRFPINPKGFRHHTRAVGGRAVRWLRRFAAASPAAPGADG